VQQTRRPATGTAGIVVDEHRIAERDVHGGHNYRSSTPTRTITTGFRIHLPPTERNDA